MAGLVALVPAPARPRGSLAQGGPTGGGCLGACLQGQQPQRGPTYLLQLGVPWELLHDQGEALGELQLARPDPLPEQHLPVGGHTQHAEVVAVPGLGEPNHLGGQGAGAKWRKRCLPPSPLPTPTLPFSSRKKIEFWGRPGSRITHQVADARVPPLVPAESQDS